MHSSSVPSNDDFLDVLNAIITNFVDTNISSFPPMTSASSEAAVASGLDATVENSAEASGASEGTTAAASLTPRPKLAGSLMNFGHTTGQL